MDPNSMIQEAPVVAASSGDVGAPTPTLNNNHGETAATSAVPEKSYDDLFPSLPGAGHPNGGRGGAGGPMSMGGGPIGGGQWNKKPVIMSSTVTQASC